MPLDNKRRSISKALRFKVFARDGFSCRYCGARRDDGAELHVDHVKPVSAGGTNDVANLVTACLPCNIGKGAVEIPEPVPFQLASIEKGEAAFGLRFDEDGYLRKQFHIDVLKPMVASVTLYSWFTGDPTDQETWLIEDLRSSCLLFSERDEWLRCASYWGAKCDRGQFNPRFRAEVQA